jgi:hypothetical protein
MEREMAEFFAVARRIRSDLLFLIVTQADPDPMLRDLHRIDVAPCDYRIVRSPPDELGRYLNAAEFGISFIRPSFSKISSSPTKIGEYLAAGLPVLSTAGIGDVDALLDENEVGVLMSDFSDEAYELSATRIFEVCHQPDVQSRCRAVAATTLSLHAVGVPRYDELYRRVAVAQDAEKAFR